MNGYAMNRAAVKRTEVHAVSSNQQGTALPNGSCQYGSIFDGQRQRRLQSRIAWLRLCRRHTRQQSIEDSNGLRRLSEKVATRFLDHVTVHATLVTRFIEQR